MGSCCSGAIVGDLQHQPQDNNRETSDENAYPDQRDTFFSAAASRCAVESEAIFLMRLDWRLS
jgi:hypothetical protein